MMFMKSNISGCFVLPIGFMLFSRESVEKVRLHWACACCMQGVSKKTMATGHAVIVKQDATKANWARPHVICAHQASVVSFVFSVTFLKLQDLLTQLEKKRKVSLEKACSLDDHQPQQQQHDMHG